MQAQLQFPIEAFLQAMQQKNQNTQNMMNQFGQGLKGFGANMGHTPQQQQPAPQGMPGGGLDLMAQNPLSAYGGQPQQSNMYAQILQMMRQGR